MKYKVVALLILLTLSLATTADSTGVVNVLVGSGCAPCTFSTTVTPGTEEVSGNEYVGYISNLIGTISNSSIPPSETIYEITELLQSGVIVNVSVYITSSASLGQTWLTSVTFNGFSFTGATATYTYSGGESEWTWTTDNGFGWVSGTAYPGQLVYQ